MIRYLLLLGLLVPVCVQAQNPLTRIFDNDELLSHLQQQEKFQIQVVYTQIDRQADQTPKLTTFELGTDSSLYYYPASTVKMPAAFLAMEKVNKLRIIGLDPHSKMEVGAGGEPQKPFVYDSTTSDGKASIAQFIKQIFVVSDNEAYNHLYSFLGQEYFNESLHKKGFRNTRITSRLGPGGFAFDFELNRYTNPITFYDDSGQVLYYQGEVYSQTPHSLDLKNEQRGVGFMRNGDLVNEPFDFSTKNFFSLRDMHDVLRSVIFPEITPEYQQFALSEKDYAFLYEWMCKLPEESAIPQYAGKPDSYVKFFIYGDREEEPIPDHVKIFNKVGWAYGFLTDVSYIIDKEAGVEFFLAATIHVNENQTYNDGEYEYETIGLPFFGRLGRAVYELEKARKRKVKPTFEKF